MFAIRYSTRARKFLKRVDRTISRRLMKKIERLREKPILSDTKKIVGSRSLFRVRVGDYRILYEVDYRNNMIGIVKIDKRSRVY